MTTPRSAPPDLPGFTLVRGIGGGGFADVYLYTQHRPNRPVAVKVLRREFLTDENLRQFDAEADLMAAVSAHPNIVTIHGVGLSPDERPYIVMEHYPKDHFGIRARNRLPVSEVLAVGVQVSSAIETAHRAGILHRDVKPANILTSAYDRPGLTDFGISGVLREGAVGGTVGVSLAFAAPEVSDGSSFGSVVADVYALAATLYTLLAGRSPFWSPEGDNDEEQLEARVRAGSVPPITRPDVPESLQRLIRTGLSTEPSVRPQTALAFGRSLQDIELERHLTPTRIELLDDIVVAPPRPGATGERGSRDGGTDDDGTRLRRAPPPVGPDPPPSSSPSPQEEPDTTLRRPVLDGYVVGDPIGEGATGVVWQARSDDSVPRPVAVKRLRVGAARGLERFRWEASILDELDHPHVLEVFEIIDVDGGVAIVMEHAPGGSLADLLADDGPLSPGEVVAVAAPLADALASAHRRGVLHGDVKAANVLFAGDGQPRLSDFGVARRFGPPPSARHGRAGGGGHLAPEVLAGAEPDPRADVYGLGAVCYEALVGRGPPAHPTWPGPAPRARPGPEPGTRAGPEPGPGTAAGGSHRRAQWAAVESLPPALLAVVERAIAGHPADRYPGADELARALRASVPPGDVRLPRRSEDTATRRGRWAVASTLLIAAAAVAVFGFKALRADGDPDPDGVCASAPPRQIVQGDTDGDGLPTSGVYELQPVEGSTCQMVLAITIDPARPGFRYQLGERDDTMLLGDWDCDDVDTPALYRRRTGEIFSFDSWPVVEGQQAPTPSLGLGAPGSEATVGTSPGTGCDEVVVAPP